MTARRMIVSTPPVRPSASYAVGRPNLTDDELRRLRQAAIRAVLACENALADARLALFYHPIVIAGHGRLLFPEQTVGEIVRRHLDQTLKRLNQLPLDDAELLDAARPAGRADGRQ